MAAQRILFFCSVVAVRLQACTVCHTDTGRQVRAGIFSSDFPLILSAMLLPFVILLAIIAVIYFGAPLSKPLRRVGRTV
ncbi:MAG TPA: hypothetical protein VES20_20175 [Bryobacteraceae bacterium]|nr:hypothetical protein [Bryobacteraceae bacterium]